jgi:hypothetical protein
MLGPNGPFRLGNGAPNIVKDGTPHLALSADLPVNATV